MGRHFLTGMLAALSLVSACDSTLPAMDGSAVDGSAVDGSSVDGSTVDGSAPDAVGTDLGAADAEPMDAEPADLAGADADAGFAPDSDVDAGDAASAMDATLPDALPSDGGVPTSTSADWSWSSQGGYPAGPTWPGIIAAGGEVHTRTGHPGVGCTVLIYDVYNDLISGQESPVQDPVLGTDGTWVLHGGGEDCALTPSPHFAIFLKNVSTGQDMTVTQGDWSPRGAAVPYSGGFFVRNGACTHSSPGTSGCPLFATLDIASLGWRAVTDVGRPSNISSTSVAASVGTQIVFWDAVSPAVYDTATDTWTAIAPPSFPLGAGPAVSLGTGVFIFDGAHGGIYDPTHSAWTQTATTALVHDLSPRLAFTGREVLALGASDGAHYDPAQDRWRPMSTFGRSGSMAEASAVWTGAELIVQLENTSFRYGPRPVPVPQCSTGQGVSVNIESPPTTRARVDAAVQRLAASGSSPQRLQSVRWLLDEAPILSSATGMVDLSSASSGAHVLRFEAEDAQGHVACDDRILYVDRPPTLTVNAPTLASAYSLGGGQVPLDISCADDLDANCSIEVSIDQTVIARGINTLRQTVDLAGYDHSRPVLSIKATDAHRETSTVLRPVFIETDPAHANLFYLPEPICDVQGYRALVDQGTNLAIVDLRAGTRAPIPAIAPAPTPDCQDSRLTPAGAVVTDWTGEVAVWDGAAFVSHWPAEQGSVQVMGNWVVTWTSGNPMLERRNLMTMVTDTMGPISPPGFLVTDGSVLWTAGTNLHRNVPGVGDRVIASGQSRGYTFPRGGPNQALWFDPMGPGHIWRVDSAGAVTELSPSGAYVATTWPYENYEFAAYGGWAAFTFEDAQLVRQVSEIDDAGLVTRVSGAGIPSRRILAIDGDGDVAYRAGTRTWFYHGSTNASRDVGGAMVRALPDGNAIWLVEDDSIRRLP